MRSRFNTKYALINTYHWRLVTYLTFTHTHTHMNSYVYIIHICECVCICWNIICDGVKIGSSLLFRSYYNPTHARILSNARTTVPFGRRSRQQRVAAVVHTFFVVVVIEIYFHLFGATLCSGCCCKKHFECICELFPIWNYIKCENYRKRSLNLTFCKTAWFLIFIIVDNS